MLPMQSFYNYNSQFKFTVRNTMTTYRVLSENCTLGKQGDTVTDDQLDGVNVAALVDGGHLAEVSVRVSKTELKETEK